MRYIYWKLVTGSIIIIWEGGIERLVDKDRMTPSGLVIHHSVICFRRCPPSDAEEPVDGAVVRHDDRQRRRRHFGRRGDRPGRTAAAQVHVAGIHGRRQDLSSLQTVENAGKCDMLKLSFGSGD